MDADAKARDRRATIYRFLPREEERAGGREEGPGREGRQRTSVTRVLPRRLPHFRSCISRRIPETRFPSNPVRGPRPSTHAHLGHAHDERGTRGNPTDDSAHLEALWLRGSEPPGRFCCCCCIFLARFGQASSLCAYNSPPRRSTRLARRGQAPLFFRSSQFLRIPFQVSKMQMIRLLANG